MIDKTKRLEKEQAKAKTKKRIYVEVDPENYDYFPETRQADYYDNDVPQRVAIYVRVSTDDVRQTTSFELQKKYYEDFVIKHPHWTLVKIYADEGISGTSLNKREQFLQMISDAKRGKIDMIITKSVSRFARNIYDFIGIVRDLAERNPPVGVFFESEGIFSLNDDSQLALSFQATMAEEESHTRSRSMETSLRMRLDNGIPLTPKLLGYMHDADGTLIPNPDEAPTVKLAFYMYLYGYSSQQIADAFNALGRKSYLGNINWTSNGIVQILRNERHCGDVLTRKTFTPNFRTHTKILALRPCGENERGSFQWCSIGQGKRKPRQTTCTLFFLKMFDMMDWNPDHRYKMLGNIIRARQALILRNYFGFFLSNCGEGIEQHLIAEGLSIDAFFLKDYADAEKFQLSHILQGFFYISREPGHRFCDDEVQMM